MVNELRTLLLNVVGADPSAVGEEYIPPDYVPQTLTPDLASINGVLFGSRPDRSALNYWASKYLTILHSSTALAPYVNAFDSRVTYLPLDSVFFNEVLSSPSVTSLIGADPLYVLGREPISSDGRLLHTWLVTIIDGSNVNLADQTGVAPAVTANYTLTAGVSDPHNLPGSPTLAVSFGATPGDVWQVRNFQRPSMGLYDVWTKLSGSYSATVERMMAGTSDPYMTLRTVWRNVRSDIHVKIGAVVLAYVNRVKELIS